MLDGQSECQLIGVFSMARKGREFRQVLCTGCGKPTFTRARGCGKLYCTRCREIALQTRAARYRWKRALERYMVEWYT